MYTAIVDETEALKAVLLALRAKGAHICEHSVHVAKLMSDIALQLRGNGYGADLLSERDTFLLGLLHDTGKLNVADGSIHKDCGLDDRERETMNSHPLWGYDFVFGIKSLRHLAVYVLQHHELPGRRGYPYRLDTHEIRLMARVLNIADRFAGMIVDRPYRKALPPEIILPKISADVQQFFGCHSEGVLAALRGIRRRDVEDFTLEFLRDNELR